MEREITIGDKSVDRLGFGAMRLCGPGVWGEPADPASARALLRDVVRLGVQLIDTADAYGPQTSEKQIAEALAPYPDDVLVATKGGFTRPGPGQWVADGHPAYLRAACEGSLQRLKLDCIELYQLHRIDANVPLEDQIGTLAELRAEGKIRHIGLSAIDVKQLRAARAIVPIVSVQNQYNLVDRSSEEVMLECGREGLAFIAYFPIDAGDLAKAGGTLGRIARAHHVSQTQIALAWLLHHAEHIVPIPGTSQLAHLRENLAARDLRLTDDEKAELDELAA